MYNVVQSVRFAPISVQRLGTSISKYSEALRMQTNPSTANVIGFDGAHAISKALIVNSSLQKITLRSVLCAVELGKVSRIGKTTQIAVLTELSAALVIAIIRVRTQIIPPPGYCCFAQVPA